MHGSKFLKSKRARTFRLLPARLLAANGLAMSRFVIVLLIPLLLSACGPGNGPSVVTTGVVANGLGFLPQQAEKGTLFRYYQPKAGSAWKNNWTSSFDLTGVSWNDSTTATLIAPQFVVMAGHYQRDPHVAVMFHDKKGNPHERYITAAKALPGFDVAVGKLNLPVPPDVKRYRFANAADATIGRAVVVSDQTKTLSVHQIAAVSGASVSFSNIPGLNPVYQRNLITGDSGNPSFIVRNGDLVLVETHTTGGPGAGPFYGDPQLQAAIRAAMTAMGN